jgi:hypothetical protein
MRLFINTPMLPDIAAVERYADSIGAFRVVGYTGPDGTYRANVEITADAAGDDIEERAREIEQQAALLRAEAEQLVCIHPAPQV